MNIRLNYYIELINNKMKIFLHQFILLMIFSQTFSLNRKKVLANNNPLAAYQMKKAKDDLNFQKKIEQKRWDIYENFDKDKMKEDFSSITQKDEICYDCITNKEKKEKVRFIPGKKPDDFKGIAKVVIQDDGKPNPPEPKTKTGFKKLTAVEKRDSLRQTKAMEEYQETLLPILEKSIPTFKKQSKTPEELRDMVDTKIDAIFEENYEKERIKILRVLLA